MSAYLAVLAAVAIAAAIRGVWSPCGLSMISAINPFTEHSRGNRYAVTSAWFIGGSVAGGLALGTGAAVGALLWGAAGTSITISAALAAACCLIAVAADCSAVPFALPTHPRQVNERWLGQYRRWVYAAGFGAQIGSGFATYIMTAAVYLTVALGMLGGAPTLALAAGALFGLIRGSAVLLSSSAGDPGALRRLHQRLDRLAPWSRRAAMTVESIAAVTLAALAGGVIGAMLAAGLLAVGGLLVLSRGAVGTRARGATRVAS